MPDDRHDLAFSFVEGEWHDVTRSFRPGIMIIAFNPHEDERDPVQHAIDAIMEEISEAEVESISRIGNWFTASGPWDPAEMESKAKELRQLADVRYAQPDFKMVGVGRECGKAFATDEQWGHNRIEAPATLAHEQGQPHVLIAVIDTGIVMEGEGADARVSHEDLDANRFVPGQNMIELVAASDAGEDVTGKYYVPDDDVGHGTLVAGIIAANGRNTVGMDGMNWDSPVVPYRAMAGWTVTDTEATIVYVTKSIEYALELVTDGIAKLVINISIAITETLEADEHLEATFSALKGNDDVIVCCGVGNDGEEKAWYPAAFSEDEDLSNNVVAVGATQEGGTEELVWDKSNRGTHVSVVAPGTAIWSTQRRREYDGLYYCYEYYDGTSYATAFVSGLVSLMWSRCPLLTAGEVVECLKNTCDSVRDADGNIEATASGSGRINARRAVPNIEVLTSSLAFVGAEPGEWIDQSVELKVSSCIPLHIHVEVDVDEDASSPNAQFAGSEILYEPSGTLGDPEIIDSLTVSYHGTSDGSVGYGTAKVTCEEFYEGWEKPFDVSGGTNKSESHVILVADKSGSMNQQSGIPGETRMQVLQHTAGVLIDYVPEKSAMGVVSFDSDAKEELGTTPIHADPEGLEDRALLKEKIEGLSPGGLTSIADGVELAQSKLDAAYDNQAVIALTDGRETAEKYLAEITGLDKDVYAIGLGTEANVETAKLSHLTGNTESYTLVTGALVSESDFKLEKYFIQILADVQGGQIALDPTGRLRKGKVHRIPFKISEADWQADVILLTPPGGIIAMQLETPRRELVNPGAMVSRFESDRVLYYRLPLDSIGRRELGTWHAVLTWVNDDRPANTDPDSPDDAIPMSHGIPYSLIVRVDSDVRLKARAEQMGYSPGDDVVLSAAITERRMPTGAKNATVNVIVKKDGTVKMVGLQGVGQGLFEARYPMQSKGVYEFRFVADGRTRAGIPFTREQIRTATVG
jgi:subtilisin family serine protease